MSLIGSMRMVDQTVIGEGQDHGERTLCISATAESTCNRAKPSGYVDLLQQDVLENGAHSTSQFTFSDLGRRD